MSKISGSSRSVKRVINIILRNVADDVLPYVTKGTESVEAIVLALPFTRYAWLLAIYQSAGWAKGSKIIIYYNSEDPRWTATFIIHELVHKALNLKRNGLTDTITDETLAYLASFKSGFLELYEKGIGQAVELLSRYTIFPGCGAEYELANTILPRIIAKRLIGYDYGYVVRTVVGSFRKLIQLWLDAKPSNAERLALTVGLSALSLNPVEYGLEKPSRPLEVMERRITSQDVEFEGIDAQFLEMVRVLEEVARNPSRKREILAPWWDEVRYVLDDLEAYIELYGAR